MTVHGWRARVAPSLPLGPPTAAVGVTFGLLAAPIIGAPASVVMSMLVWSGTAQFAAISAVTAGAGVGVAAGTGLLANSRYLPMGFAIAPAAAGSRRRRVGVAATLADASFVLAHRRDGSFDVAALVWAAPVQYLSWVLGTVVGALGTQVIADPNSLGLDALFPVFYLSLLLPDLKPDPASGRRPWTVAALSVVITLVATPPAPRRRPRRAGHRQRPDRSQEMNTATTWILIAVLALGSLAAKICGPVLAGGRIPPAPAQRVITLLTPALLTSPVITGTLATGHHLTIDARLAGTATGLIALLLRTPLFAALLIAAASPNRAAVIRPVTWRPVKNRAGSLGCPARAP